LLKPHPATGKVRPKRRYFIPGILLASGIAAMKIAAMIRRVSALLLLAAIAAGGVLLWLRYGPRIRARIPDDFQKLSGAERVAAARRAKGKAVAQLCADAGIGYPPRELFLRAFKHEAELEVWARSTSGACRLLKTYPILAASGRLGPKRREGDRQVPEGFYRIDRFNPESLYHLSLGLDYPNASDRILSDPERPGSDIFIHGKDVTVGCLPMGDDAIEELFLLALDTRDAVGREIAVHIFPARMRGASWAELEREYAVNQPELREFWAALRHGFEAFERDRIPPHPTVEPDGAYRFPAGKSAD
jgi:hypothetical protein